MTETNGLKNQRIPKVEVWEFWVRLRQDSIKASQWGWKKSLNNWGTKKIGCLKNWDTTV